MALVPPRLTSPGVYIQEAPIDGHTLVGVTTSVTAFLGRTAWGPTAKPITVSSFDEFREQFGGVLQGSPMTYAVEDFFLNGGATAIILRLFDGPPDATLPWHPWDGIGAIANVPASPVELEKLFAASPGAWGKELTYFTTPATTAADGALFDLTITRTSNGSTVKQEIFSALSANPAGDRT